MVGVAPLLSKEKTRLSERIARHAAHPYPRKLSSQDPSAPGGLTGPVMAGSKAPDESLAGNEAIVLGRIREAHVGGP